MTKVEIKDGKLVIVADLESPRPSASGKTLTIASTHGFMATGATLEGKVVHVSLNVYVKK